MPDFLGQKSKGVELKMKHFIKSFALLFIFTLVFAGCGGSGSSTPAPGPVIIKCL